MNLLDTEIFRATDVVVLERAKAAIENAEHAVQALVLGVEILGNHSTTFQNVFSDEKIAPILAHHSYLLNSIKVQLNNSISITIQRQPQKLFDKLTVEIDDAVSRTEEINQSLLHLLASLREELREANSQTYISEVMAEKGAQYIDAWEKNISLLQGVAASITQRMIAFATQKDQETERKKEALDAAYIQRTKELENHFEEKQKKLEQELQTLEARKQEVDDRDNRHARREIRQDFKQAIATRIGSFTPTKDTIESRKALEIFVIALMISIGGLLAFIVVYQVLYQSDKFLEFNFASLFMLLRNITLTVFLTGLVIYYIRWKNRWAAQYAKEEFRLRRLDLDMDRASWLVEMALEWKHVSGNEIPDAILLQLSTNLFTEDSEQEEILHPADELASALLGTASHLSLNLAGNKGTIEMNRRGINKLRKTILRTGENI